jgi:DNA-binding SARP family transcriptional activator
MGPARRLLRCYGPLVVEGSDGTGLGQRATRGLIAYLAVKRADASAGELLEALWPGQPAARPRLWKARFQAQALVGDALQRDRDLYRLVRDRLPVDSDEIERLLRGPPALERLEQALRLAGGEPLANVDYPWAETERRRLQALQIDVLIRVTAARLEAGDAHGALATAERLIQLEPLNEHGWRVAMEAEAALGRRQAVLDRFEQLRRELDRRLGLRPDAATRETYRRLLGQS